MYSVFYSSCAVRKYAIRREKFLLEQHRDRKGQFTLTCRYERTYTELQNNAVISNSTFHVPNHPTQSKPPQTFYWNPYSSCLSLRLNWNANRPVTLDAEEKRRNILIIRAYIVYMKYVRDAI